MDGIGLGCFKMARLNTELVIMGTFSVMWQENSLSSLAEQIGPS